MSKWSVQSQPPSFRSPPPARAALCAFYRNAAELVDQQLAREFEGELAAAFNLVLAVEDDDWGW